MLKLIEPKERNPENRCWFCRTNRSVKYTAKFVNPNTKASNRYMDILVCNKCATNHMNDFPDETAI